MQNEIYIGFGKRYLKASTELFLNDPSHGEWKEKSIGSAGIVKVFYPVAHESKFWASTFIQVCEMYGPDYFLYEGEANLEYLLSQKLGYMDAIKARMDKMYDGMSSSVYSWMDQLQCSTPEMCYQVLNAIAASYSENPDDFAQPIKADAVPQFKARVMSAVKEPEPLTGEEQVVHVADIKHMLGKEERNSESHEHFRALEEITVKPRRGSRVAQLVAEKYTQAGWVFLRSGLIYNYGVPGMSPYCPDGPLYEFYIYGEGQNRKYTKDNLLQRQQEQEKLYDSLLKEIATEPRMFLAQQKLSSARRDLRWRLNDNMQLPIKKRREMLRDLEWAYRSVLRWIRQNMVEERDFKPRERHLPEAPMHDMVIDGVVWNPVMFRRFVPRQILRKVHSLMDYADMLEQMNKPTVLRYVFGKEDLVESNSFMDEYTLRSRGYDTEADFYQSMPDLPIARMALVYWERCVVLSRALCGEDVTGELNRIKIAVRGATREELEKAFWNIAKVPETASYDQFPSVI